MAELLQRFSGNPFSTPVGQKIDKATDVTLTSEDWGLNMEICDLINDTEDGARDAVRAIKKRLQQNAGKNFTVFMLTLTVLETCVKNCGKRFHVLVTNKDFVQELVKQIGPKNDPPPAVQEKVLSLIQSWAEAFYGQPDLQGVSVVYNELRNKGIAFPKSLVEPKVPIHTPNRSAVSKSSELSSSPPNIMSAPIRNISTKSPTAQGNKQTTNVAYPINLTPEQMNKLKVELDVVQLNMKIFSEMLTELKPGDEHNDDWDLLVELSTTCQSMQKRIVDLIEKVANEEVTNELLRINDELNNLFMRYERYQKKRNVSSEPSQDISMIASTSEAIPSVLKSKAPEKSQITSLIDFTDEEPDLLNDMKDLQIVPPQQTTKNNKSNENFGDQEFDMFAQSRSSTSQTNQELMSLPGNEQNPSVKSTELNDREVNEIERWLSDNPLNTPSMQFEQFLERRSNALEQQPIKKSSINQDASLI